MARTTTNTSGYIIQPKLVNTNKFMVIGDRVHEIKTVVVHRFKMSDVEDPDLYAAQPLLEWQKSEMGQWIMERAVDTPEWHRQSSQMDWHTQYAIVAKLKDVDYTFWILKWGNAVDKKT